jgi:hypothetical protein
VLQIDRFIIVSIMRNLFPADSARKYSQVPRKRVSLRDFDGDRQQTSPECSSLEIYRHKIQKEPEILVSLKCFQIWASFLPSRRKIFVDLINSRNVAGSVAVSVLD